MRLRSCTSPHIALAAMLCALLCPADPARAAVRVCKAPVVGDIVEDSIERQALRRALDSWKRKAVLNGIRFGSWRLAINRTYKCARRPSGTFTCVAVGRPCTISQRPPPRDFGAPPRGGRPAPKKALPAPGARDI